MEKKGMDKEIVLNGVYKTSLYQEHYINIPATIARPKPQITRVIAYDRDQIFYDTWLENNNNWACLSQSISKIYFNRTSVRQFLLDSTFLHIDSMTESEKKIYRPDLPLSLCRFKNINWFIEGFSELSFYEEKMQQHLKESDINKTIAAPKLILVPQDKKAAPKKGILVEANNKSSFSCLELLWHAQKIRTQYSDAVKYEGIGLHRLGLENGIPSFYIDGYSDKIIA